MDAPALRPLPDARRPMLGVAALRDELVSVYDVRPLLDLDDAPSEAGAMLLFARGAKRVGLAIDDVFDAIVVEPGDLRSAPGTEAADGILVGVVRRGPDLIGVLNAGALLDAALAMTDGDRA
jgi:chemotaxis signal transduction protein